MDTEPPKVRVPRGSLPNFARAIARWVHPPPTLETIEKVEAYAQELRMQVSNGIQATGVKVGKGRGKSAPWWTSKCKAARVEYREAT
ncbi:hypothetical protein K3495_g6466 [Podosphaera aphanis]|nr:hypothetical protein K3495_g6466 [Podosphaera aphanis]